MDATSHLPIREPLSRTECLSRLNQSSLARIVLTIKCLPAALPAHMTLIGDHLVLASADPAVVAAATNHEVLTVQVDGVEENGGPWSVAASGHSGLTDEQRPQALPIRLDEQLISVPLEIVSGQRTL